MKRALAVLVVALLAVLLNVILFVSSVSALTFEVIVVPDDFETISGALAKADDGDTLLVRNGTYIEQMLEINKSVTIKSEHVGGAEISLHPTVKIQGTFLTVFDDPLTISADDVEISGFSITSDGGQISVTGNRTQVLNISTVVSLVVSGWGSQIVNNTLWGLRVLASNSTVTGNSFGYVQSVGSFNTFAGNSAEYIDLEGSKNIVNENSFSGRGVGIRLIGDYNVIFNNTEVGGTTGITVSGSYNVVAGNTVREGELWGVGVEEGSYNVFYGNLVSESDGYGLTFGGGGEEVAGNLFFGNVFMENVYNFDSNYAGLAFNFFDDGVMGNYWDDYLARYPGATEVGHSGIGNFPYQVYDDCLDTFPLLHLPEVSDFIPVLPEPWASLVYVPESFASPVESALPISLLMVIVASTAIICFGLVAYFLRRKKRNAK